MVEKINVDMVRPDLLVYTEPGGVYEIEVIDSEKAIAREITVEWSKIIKSFDNTEDLVDASINISKIIGKKTGEELKAYYKDKTEPVSKDAENIKKRATSPDQSLPKRLVGYRALSYCGGSEEAAKEFLEAREKAENKKEFEIPKEIVKDIPRAAVGLYATYGLMQVGYRPLDSIDDIYGSAFRTTLEPSINIRGEKICPICKIKLEIWTTEGEKLVGEMKEEIVDKLKESERGPPLNLGSYQLLEQAQRLGTKLLWELSEINYGDIIEVRERNWREKLFLLDP